MAKSKSLRKIIAGAADKLARGVEKYSCLAMRQMLPMPTRNDCDSMFDRNLLEDWYSKETYHFNRQDRDPYLTSWLFTGDGPVAHSDKEALQHRLMWLAWLLVAIEEPEAFGMKFIEGFAP